MVDNPITGRQGWRQFLSNKYALLAAYNESKDLQAGKPVQTGHGITAERVFRDFLAQFLPKRFAVAGGYLVCHRKHDTDALYHFDVIIYDALEAPTLWIDVDSQCARAIPVENVLAVFEVKAALTTESAKAATEKLCSLREHSHVDSPTERYPKYLPIGFFCASVFFELRKRDERLAILDHLVPDEDVRGYVGALILTGDGAEAVESGATGSVVLVQSEGIAPPANNGDRLSGRARGFWTSQADKTWEDLKISASLTWSLNHWAVTLFEWLARLKGQFEPGFISSFHVLGRRGQSEDK